MYNFLQLINILYRYCYHSSCHTGCHGDSVFYYTSYIGYITEMFKQEERVSGKLNSHTSFHHCSIIVMRRSQIKCPTNVFISSNIVWLQEATHSIE